MPVSFNRCFKCMSELDAEGKCKCGFDNSSLETPPKYLQPGSSIHNRYYIGRILGEGAYGITYMGWDDFDNKAVAVKEYFPVALVERDTSSATGKHVNVKKGIDGDMYREGLKTYDHDTKRLKMFNGFKGIVQVLDSFKENSTAYIIMDYVNGVTVTEYIKRNRVVKPETVFNMMKSIIESLERMHKVDMLHYNINPDDIMIKSNGRATLVNFDTACGSTDDEGRSLLLKPGYAPLEQYYVDGQQGPWTDVYAIAAVMYTMLTGVNPPDALSRNEKDTLQGFDEFRIRIPQSQADTLMKALSVDPAERIQNMNELHTGLYENITPLESEDPNQGNTKALPRSDKDDTIDAFVKIREESTEASNQAQRGLGSFVPSFGRKNNQDKSEERPYDALLKNDDEPKSSDSASSTVPPKSNVPASSNVPPKSNVPTSSNVPPSSNVPTSSNVPPKSNVPTSAESNPEKKDIPNADPSRPNYKNLPRTAKDDVFDSFVSSRVDDYVREETIVDKIVQNLKFIIPGVIVLIVVIFILVRCNSSDNTPKTTTPPQSTPTETLPPSDTSSESSDTSSSEATSEDTSSSEVTSEDASSEEDTTSDGPLTMVDVKGMDKDKAKKAIEGIVSGLTVKFKEKNSDDVKAGRVMDQSVAADEHFAPGELSEVTLTISAGPAKVTVPSVANMNRASAISTLKKAGLKAKISRSEYSSDFGKDRVISQSPSGNVEPGTTISLIISKGPKPAPKKTPAPTQKPSSSSTKPTATKKPSPIG